MRKPKNASSFKFSSFPDLWSHKIGIQPSNLLINGKGNVHNVIKKITMKTFRSQIFSEDHGQINNLHAISGVPSTKRAAIPISIHQQHEPRLPSATGD